MPPQKTSSTRRQSRRNTKRSTNRKTKTPSRKPSAPKKRSVKKNNKKKKKKQSTKKHSRHNHHHHRRTSDYGNTNSQLASLTNIVIEDEQEHPFSSVSVVPRSIQTMVAARPLQRLTCRFKSQWVPSVATYEDVDQNEGQEVILKDDIDTGLVLTPSTTSLGTTVVIQGPHVDFSDDDDNDDDDDNCNQPSEPSEQALAGFHRQEDRQLKELLQADSMISQLRLRAVNDDMLVTTEMLQKQQQDILQALSAV
jgi:hypothetical protein